MRGKGPGSKRSSAQIVPVVRKQAIGEKEARRNGKGVAQQQHPAPAPVSSGMARGSQQQISPTDSSTLLSRGLVLADLRQRLFGILIELPHSFPAVLVRSEEHTSELQSRLHLVCRLLLEKKKTWYESIHRVAITMRSVPGSLSAIS